MRHWPGGSTVSLFCQGRLFFPSPRRAEQICTRKLSEKAFPLALHPSQTCPWARYRTPLCSRGIAEWSTPVEDRYTEQQQCQSVLKSKCEGGHSCKRGSEKSLVDRLHFFLSVHQVTETKTSEIKSFSLDLWVQMNKIKPPGFCLPHHDGLPAERKKKKSRTESKCKTK